MEGVFYVGGGGVNERGRVGLRGEREEWAGAG